MNQETTPLPIIQLPGVRSWVEAVHAARTWKATVKAEIDRQLAAWAETNKPLLDSMIEATSELHTAEDGLREEATRQYKDMGQSEVGCGVKILMVKAVRYDDQTALDWATKYGLCLTLDRQAFSRLVKAGQAREVAEITETPHVTIPTDIGAALNLEAASTVTDGLCYECGQERLDDERTTEHMKCFRCAYAGEEQASGQSD